MGWASGSEIAAQVWDNVREFIPVAKRKDVARRVVKTFEAYDCDTMDEAEQLIEDCAYARRR